ncbi:spore coat protein [Priestia megaterium]|uniref:spore coat protein n=1 Tax=Priestia megaterium TaxID=1404 RepID=UPI002DBBC71E|nr:spore coat protein [Priestia megaterium]MEC1069983.1 spore coat protein [Priestia megaterium]
MGEKKWRALDHCEFGNNGAAIDQDADAVSSLDQGSFEWIIVKDSEGVTVDTVDTQAAAQLQFAVQGALAIIFTLLAGNVQGKIITQELNALLKTNQKNTQKTVIEGSKNITVSTVDTDVAANIQLTAQTVIAALIALVAGNISGG